MSVLAASLKYTTIASSLYSIIGALVWLFVGTPVMLIMAAVLIPGWFATCGLIRLIGGPE